jgi:diguanylate cyclase (GGDEF)-like protein
MHIATYLVDIAALGCLMGLLYSDTALSTERRRPFLAAALLSVVAILSEAGTIFASPDQLNLRSWHTFFNAVGFAISPVIPLAITLIFSRGLFRTRKLLLVPTLLNLLTAALSPRFGLIFSVNAQNQYARGGFFFIFVTAYVTNLVLLILITLQVGKTSNYPMAGKLAALSVFTIAGTSIQLLYPTVYTTWHCVTLVLLFYFLLLAEFDSSFDELTCLYNRAAFDQAVRQMGASEPFSLIMLDIDDFKAINDTYGHDCGDGVIKTIAAVIRASFGKGYTCYRVGGDEFSIIGGETEKAGLERQLEQFATNLAAARTPGQLLPTVSYGYSIFPGGSRLDFSQVRQEADDQMYRCKRTHKAEDAQSQAGK